MDSERVTVRPGPPDPGSCSQASDVGRTHYDPEADIWYGCVFDPRLRCFTWSIDPPTGSDDR